MLQMATSRLPAANSKKTSFERKPHSDHRDRQHPATDDSIAQLIPHIEEGNVSAVPFLLNVTTEKVIWQQRISLWSLAVPQGGPMTSLPYSGSRRTAVIRAGRAGGLAGELEKTA